MSACPQPPGKRLGNTMKFAHVATPNHRSANAADATILDVLSLALIGNASEQTLGAEGILMRGVFDKETEEAAGVCGGRGALWDLNGSRSANRHLGEHRRSGMVVWQSLLGAPVPAEVCADGGAARRGDGVGTGMYRRAGAHLRSSGKASATTNRSQCMWIIRQP
jgi:hypothetical protein